MPLEHPIVRARQNILLIRLKSIGDIVLTLPAVRLMRQAFPDARIAFLISEEYASLLAGVREVDEAILLNRSCYRQGNPIRICRETFRLLRQVRVGRFSIVVDFQGSGETAWLTWFSGAARRWGSVNRAGRSWAYTHPIRRDDHLHPAEWNLALLRQCGVPHGRVVNTFAVPESALNEARLFFAEHRLSPRQPTLCLQPFTSRPYKNWPLERYLELAAFWRARGVQIIVSGGPADSLPLQQAREEGFAVAAGLPLLTAAGVMKLSALIVGGDTGLLHLAVALGQRVLMLLHSAPPGTAVPFGHPEWSIAPSTGQGMEGISLDAVVNATLDAVALLPRSTVP